MASHEVEASTDLASAAAASFPVSLPEAGNHGRRRVLAWCALAALLAAQFVFFVSTARREVTWFVPMSYDQCTYLLHSYGVYEHMEQNGVGPGIEYGLSMPLPTGSLLHIFAPLLFLITGPTRLAALTINFALYALCQCSLAGTLAWYTRRWSVAFLGVGLLLAAMTPFSFAGGMFDFRLDFGAFCLLCVVVCAVVRSRFFESRRWALVVGLAAAVLALYRHIALVYLTGIFGICLLFVLARMLWKWRDRETRRLTLRRLTSGALAGVILAGVMTPVLFLKRDAMWNYYVVGHLIGEEKKVREAEVGVHDLIEKYLFYVHSAEYHTGDVFLITAAACLVGGLVLCLLSRRWVAPLAGGLGAPATDTALMWVFCLACLVVPYTILSWDVAKSIVVGNVLVVALVWLALLPVLALARRNFTSKLWPRILTVCGVAVLICGSYVQVQAHHQNQFSGSHPDDAAQIVAVHNDLVRYCNEAGLQRPQFSCDFIVEFLCAPVTSVWAYETQHRMLPITQTAGLNILLTDEKLIFEALQKSDFVLLTSGSIFASDAYPFHQRMKELRPRLSEYCERELVRLQSYHILDTTVQLYVRPGVTAPGGTP